MLLGTEMQTHRPGALDKNSCKDRVNKSFNYYYVVGVSWKFFQEFLPLAILVYIILGEVNVYESEYGHSGIQRD